VNDRRGTAPPQAVDSASSAADTPCPCRPLTIGRGGRYVRAGRQPQGSSAPGAGGVRPRHRPLWQPRPRWEAGRIKRAFDSRRLHLRVSSSSETSSSSVVRSRDAWASRLSVAEPNTSANSSTARRLRAAASCLDDCDVRVHHVHPSRPDMTLRPVGAGPALSSPPRRSAPWSRPLPRSDSRRSSPSGG
jgi:hypothetical protein